MCYAQIDFHKENTASEGVFISHGGIRPLLAFLQNHTEPSSGCFMSRHNTIRGKSQEKALFSPKLCFCHLAIK